MEFKTILFDLDGTLLDSQRDIFKAMGAALDDMGVCYKMETLNSLAGIPLSTVLKILNGEDHTTQEEIEYFKKKYRHYYHQYMFDTTVPFPGVMETLAGMTTCKMGVATSKPLEYAIPLIRHFNIENKMEVIQGCDDLPAKPDPAVFLKAMERMSVKPENALVVGDTKLDMTAGKKAGCTTCLVEYGGEVKVNEDYQPDYRIRTFPELWRILAWGKE